MYNIYLDLDLDLDFLFSFIFTNKNYFILSVYLFLHYYTINLLTKKIKLTTIIPVRIT